VNWGYGGFVAGQHSDKKRRSVNSQWTDETEKKLLELHDEGLNYTEIGRRLGGRPAGVIKTKLLYLSGKRTAPKEKKPNWRDEFIDSILEKRND